MSSVEAMKAAREALDLCFECGAVADIARREAIQKLDAAISDERIREIYESIPWGKGHKEFVVDFARALLSERPGWVSEWQPIETAPKEGTRILIRGWGNVGVAGFEQGAWYFVNDAHVSEDAPTHWMPLPAAPKETK